MSNSTLCASASWPGTGLRRRSLLVAVAVVSALVASLVTAPLGAPGAARADSAPPPPTNITVNPDAQAGAVFVGWTAPAGDAPNSYQVLHREVGSTDAPTLSAVPVDDGVVANPFLVTGLTDGTSYEFAVRALYIDDDDDDPVLSDSEYSAPVVPYGLPGAPGDPAPTPGAGQVTLDWAPAAENGRPISGYEIHIEPDPGGGPVPVDAGQTSATITGLANGTIYTFTVIAENLRGTTSATPFVATPLGVPGAPTITSAVPGDSSITVTWVPPSDDGGSPVVSYTVTTSAAGAAIATVVNATGDELPTTVEVSGLTNGTAYTIVMTARTAEGFTSALSEPVGPVTPAVVQAPTLDASQPGVAPTTGGVVELLGSDLAAVTSVGVVCGATVVSDIGVTSATPNSLSFAAPAGCPVGTAQVTVTNSAGPSQPVNLRYRAVPTLAESPVSPVAAAAGSTLTLTGTGFSDVGEMTVTIGGVEVNVTAATATTLTVQIGDLGAAGVKPIVVTTLGSPLLRATALSAFTFQIAAPPDSGSAPPVSPPGGAAPPSGSSPTPGTPVIREVPTPATPGAPVRAEVSLPTGPLLLDMRGLRASGSNTPELRVVPVSGAPATGATGVSLLGGHLEISLTGGDFTDVDLCVPFRAADLVASGRQAEDLRLLHFVGSEGRIDITTTVDPVARQVCGRATSFSPFGVGAYDTVRLAGADRYRTAIEISRATFPSGAPVVYLANGVQFPDALAAAPAAVREAGPVLLTAPGSLSMVVRTELQRLGPTQVIIVGGTQAVSPAVEAAVRAAVPGADVQRRAGANRYATAAAISAAIFPAGIDTVYVATGRAAPDALAGAAAAGADGSPVVLVPGTGSGAGVPEIVATELQRLAPRNLVILGGTAAVTAAVERELEAIVPDARITRVAGVDRYDTAARLARPCTATGRVYVATGTQFADALAGAVAAGRDGCPMLLVPPAGLTTRLRSAVSGLSPTDIRILGGSAAVSFRAEGQLAAFLS